MTKQIETISYEEIMRDYRWGYMEIKTTARTKVLSSNGKDGDYRGTSLIRKRPYPRNTIGP